MGGPKNGKKGFGRGSLFFIADGITSREFDRITSDVAGFVGGRDKINPGVSRPLREVFTFYRDRCWVEGKQAVATPHR